MRPVHKWLLWLSATLTGVTGGVHWWMRYMLQPVDPWAVINHPLQPLVLKAHIVVAPVLVFALGLIATEHVWRHLRAGVRPGRRSGLLQASMIAPMVFSGYLIQAVTRATWLTVMVWLHVGASVAFLLGLAVHQWGVGRRRAPGRYAPIEPDDPPH